MVIYLDGYGNFAHTPIQIRYTLGQTIIDGYYLWHGAELSDEVINEISNDKQ